MAFPTTSVLDNFNRTNEGPPPSASWTTTTNWSGIKVLSNAATANTSGATNSALYTAATYQNAEAYFTIATRSTGLMSSAGIYLRAKDNASTTIDGYFVEWADTDNDGVTESITVYRVDNGAFTQLGALISRTCADGYKLGAEMNGDTITVYTDEGAGWTSRGTRTDSTYGSAGNVGLMCYESGTPTGVFDDFGGGDVGGAVVTRKFQRASVLGV